MVCVNSGEMTIKNLRCVGEAFLSSSCVACISHPRTKNILVLLVSHNQILQSGDPHFEQYPRHGRSIGVMGSVFVFFQNFFRIFFLLWIGLPNLDSGCVKSLDPRQKFAIKGVNEPSVLGVG